MKFRKIIAAIASAVAITLSSASAHGSEIVVGGKNFTEQLLLSEMTVQLLASNGYGVRKMDGMGSTVVRKAIENAQVHVYWEYVGTALINYNKIKERMSAADAFAKVKELDAKKGIVWLNPSSANNTYALAVRASDDKGLDTLSDMAAAYNSGANLKMAGSTEFPKRPDGLLGLQKAYDFKAGRANVLSMEPGLIYQALKEGEVDIGSVFSTDGRIAAFDLKVLKDGKGFFPNYALAPNIRQEVLEANPKVGALLNRISESLDDSTMRRLNAMVDVDRKTIGDVARMFLQEKGLI